MADEQIEHASQIFWFRVSLTILGTVALGISSWAINRTICLTEDIAAIRVELRSLDQKIDNARDNKQEETRQNVTLSKHWKLHSWAHDELSAIKHKLEMGEAKWPDFD